MYLLGVDLGSSSVKVSVLDAKTGALIGSAQEPAIEMGMIAKQPGWAEQKPSDWYSNFAKGLAKLSATGVDLKQIDAMGISYQMHGLVVVDDAQKVLRPAIIWCDSRAVEIGNAAFEALGHELCLGSYLNSPGNFTASKLKWVRENEPEIYAKIKYAMLPGDWLAMELSGVATTTFSGLSEGILYDFVGNKLASKLLNHYGIEESLFPTVVPTFGEQVTLNATKAAELGLQAGVKICYRAGDQPNNAFSLNVLEPGEVCANAGTSGVIYGVNDKYNYDLQSRVNTFAHVNHTAAVPRLGILACVNGTGILNSWLKKTFSAAGTEMGYAGMNEMASKVKPGSEGLQLYPFGNGAERILGNKEIGASMQGIDFHNHGAGHLARAAQEGIVFALFAGIEIMQGCGMQIGNVKAGMANMFLSPVFREVFCAVGNCSLTMLESDGSQGAARGAGVGLGLFSVAEGAQLGLKKLAEMEPTTEMVERYAELYAQWTAGLAKQLA